MFKYFIWDFDGTLFDTYPGMVKAFKRTFMDAGVELEDEEVLIQLKNSFPHALKYFSEKYKVNPDGILQRTLSYENGQEDSEMAPYNGAKEICSLIAENGGKNFLLTHRDKRAVELLKSYDMEELFTDVVIKEHGFKRKPHPEAFSHLIKKHGLNRQITIGIGDRELDIVAARDAGIKTCLFKSYDGGKDFGADYIIENLLELTKLI